MSEHTPQDNSDDFMWSGVHGTKMPKSKESDKLKTKIQKWLTEDGYRIKNTPDLNSEFYLSATLGGHNMGVIYPADTIDKIILVSGAVLSDDHVAKLSITDQKNLDNLLWSLQFGLLSRNINFKIDNPLTRIDLQRIIYGDGLSKNIFMNETINLHNAVRYTFMMLEKYIVDNSTVVNKTPKGDIVGYG